MKFCRDSPTYPMGLMYFIFHTFVQFKEDHKSRPYDIDAYIPIESLCIYGRIILKSMISKKVRDVDWIARLVI